jgi:hypothetical protein
VSRSGACARAIVAFRASVSACVAGVDLAWFLRTMITELVELVARDLTCERLSAAFGAAALLTATTMRLAKTIVAVATAHMSF